MVEAFLRNEKAHQNIWQFNKTKIDTPSMNHTKEPLFLARL